ncbi:phage portal protein [Leptospira interrogans serovar Hebdomadis str. R499]|uniref:phage portal protein n=1 Tax=Leptospira interrogans TaxID=173 RepID=UPI000297250C|nr:phage portal protein [Leptospira interrogans]EKR34405.1 phage portal protein [Leptospira interrogans serovar Hebdomadis str. R499]
MESKNKQSNKPLAAGQGWAIYSPESFSSRLAQAKDGTWKEAKVRGLNNWFTLDPWQCLDIFKLNYNVFSIVSQRSQIISGMDYKIIPSRNIEDEIAEDLKELKWKFDQIDDYDTNTYSKIKRDMYAKKIREHLGLFELKTDLSNFDSALRFWSRRIKRETNASASQIEDWLQITKRFEINDGGEFVTANVQGFQDFLLQYVQDMLIHGRAAIQNPNEYFDGLWVLPGGSVYPIPSEIVGQTEFYVQLMYGMSGYGQQIPKFFNPTDLSMSYYLPNSAVVYGLKPLDAVIYQIQENFNFASYMADHANNEKPPEYVIFVVDAKMELTDNLDDFTKTDSVELERQEAILNEKQKDKAVRILKQTGSDAKLFNLSKENTIADHQAREEVIKKIIARVFGATQNEMGETDTGGMIAKAGAEAQQELYNRQSIKPIAKSIEEVLTFEVLPSRWGIRKDLKGREILWNFKFMSVDSDIDKYTKAKIAKDSGSISVNEIREHVLGIDPTANPEDNQITPVSLPPDNNDLMKAITQLKVR